MVTLTQSTSPGKRQQPVDYQRRQPREMALEEERNGVESALISSVYFRDFHYSLKTGDLQLATPLTETSAEGPL